MIESDLTLTDNDINNGFDSLDQTGSSITQNEDDDDISILPESSNTKEFSETNNDKENLGVETEEDLEDLLNMRPFKISTIEQFESSDTATPPEININAPANASIPNEKHSDLNHTTQQDVNGADEFCQATKPPTDRQEIEEADNLRKENDVPDPEFSDQYLDQVMQETWKEIYADKPFMENPISKSLIKMFEMTIQSSQLEQRKMNRCMSYVSEVYNALRNVVIHQKHLGESMTRQQEQIDTLIQHNELKAGQDDDVRKQQEERLSIIQSTINTVSTRANSQKNHCEDLKVLDLKLENGLKELQLTITDLTHSIIETVSTRINSIHL